MEDKYKVLERIETCKESIFWLEEILKIEGLSSENFIINSNKLFFERTKLAALNWLVDITNEEKK